MYEMTDKQWEAIPERYRASWRKTIRDAEDTADRMGDAVAVSLPDGGWGPYGACHVSHVRKKAKAIEAPPLEITIAVWATGEIVPIKGTPEEHVADNMGCLPARYESFELNGDTWLKTNSRRVEMRPVVLP